MIENDFTPTIKEILISKFGDNGLAIFQSSELLNYLNIKTKSVSRGSKSRGSFGNLYAIFTLVEDYINGNFQQVGGYENYAGAKFTNLLKRQRELPFGNKLQNHALNHRMNQEFRKYFPTCSFLPILRNVETNRYWINENLLIVELGGKSHNIANSIVDIVQAYVKAKRDAFDRFILSCENIQNLRPISSNKAFEFISTLVQPNVDARIFEIVSYAILKLYYAEHSMYWGWARDDIHEAGLILYKTGRTNANDGGIDFVMRPLGRFFQVTETTDVSKYFLDIDKVQRYPITFVVKSTKSVNAVKEIIANQAKNTYSVMEIVERYMACVEEIINIPILLERFEEVVSSGGLELVIEEIILQSKVEFNYTKA